MLTIVKSAAVFGYQPPVHNKFQQHVMDHWNVERMVVLQALLQRIEKRTDLSELDRKTLIVRAEEKVKHLALARHCPLSVAAELQAFLTEHKLA